MPWIHVVYRQLNQGKTLHLSLIPIGREVFSGVIYLIIWVMNRNAVNSCCIQTADYNVYIILPMLLVCQGPLECQDNPKDCYLPAPAICPGPPDDSMCSCSCSEGFSVEHPNSNKFQCISKTIILYYICAGIIATKRLIAKNRRIFPSWHSKLVVIL